VKGEGERSKKIRGATGSSFERGTQTEGGNKRLRNERVRLVDQYERGVKKERNKGKRNVEMERFLGGNEFGYQSVPYNPERDPKKTPLGKRLSAYSIVRPRKQDNRKDEEQYKINKKKKKR